MRGMNNAERRHEAIELDDHFSDNMHLLSITATSRLATEGPINRSNMIRYNYKGNSSERHWRHLVWLMCLGCSSAWSDPFLLPQSTKEALDLVGMVSLIFATAFLAKLLFAVFVMLFVLMHLALIGVVIAGLVRKRFWRKGIQFCLIGLALMYVALFALWRAQGKPDGV